MRKWRIEDSEENCTTSTDGGVNYFWNQRKRARLRNSEKG